MNKLVKIKFRDKTSITVDIDQAEKIMNSKEQVIMIYDEDGKWTGKSINKSEITGTDRDFYDENRESTRGNALAITEPVISEEKRKELLIKYKPDFKKPYADQ